MVMQLHFDFTSITHFKGPGLDRRETFYAYFLPVPEISLQKYISLSPITSFTSFTYPHLNFFPHIIEKL